jgi:hypothetical protein
LYRPRDGASDTTGERPRKQLRERFVDAIDRLAIKDLLAESIARSGSAGPRSAPEGSAESGSRRGCPARPRARVRLREGSLRPSHMKLVSISLFGVLVGGVAQADHIIPLITNHDDKWYQLQLDCKHVSAGQSISPDQTLELDQFKVDSDCKVKIYPYDNPFGKDGDYDPKKRLSTTKLKRSSECVIKGSRITCE